MLSEFGLLSALVHGVWSQQCNPLVGPSGATSCIQLQAHNNRYQWAIGLTNIIAPFRNKVAKGTIVEPLKRILLVPVQALYVQHRNWLSGQRLLFPT